MFNLAIDDLAVKPSHTKVYFNEFVANALCDNKGQKNEPPTSKLDFQLRYKFVDQLQTEAISSIMAKVEMKKDIHLQMGFSWLFEAKN